MPWNNWWNLAFSSVKCAHAYCLSDKLASQCSTIKQLWNQYGKEKFLLNLYQRLFIELRGISSGFIFVMPWSMRMHAFYSVLTNKLVFLLIICRSLTCLVSGMNVWKKQIKNSVPVLIHADETQLMNIHVKQIQVRSNVVKTNVF